MSEFIIAVKQNFPQFAELENIYASIEKCMKLVGNQGQQADKACKP